MKKAQDIEDTIQRKSIGSVRSRSRVLLRKSFWGRRPDGVAINETLQIGYSLEFKLSTDRDEGFQEVKEAESNEKRNSIVCALKAAAPEWEFEQISFVLGNRGSGVKSDFYSKLNKLAVTRRKIRQALHRSCDTIIRGAQSGDCFLRPADARRYKANHEFSRAKWRMF